MKKVAIILILVLSNVLTGFGQNQKPVFVSNPGISFDSYMSGVKYAQIGLNALNQDQVDKKTGIAGFYYLAQNYLKEMGFEYVALTSSEKTALENSVESYCDYTMVMFGGDINKSSISNMTITFITCMGDIYAFTSDKKFNYGKFADVEKKLTEDWRSIVNTKSSYKDGNRLQLPSNPTSWTKEKIVQYLADNKGKLASVEGIYERVRLSFEDISGGKYTVGVIKNPDAEGFLVIYLSGARNYKDWTSGEIKAALNSTATNGFYSVDWISRDKSLYEDVYCNVDLLGLNVYSSGMMPISYKFIKILPLNE